MIPIAIAEQVGTLIDRYRLHGSYDSPVDTVRLDALEPCFPVIRRPMAQWGIEGFVIPPPGIISESNPAPITIDSRLNGYHARLVYAHEIGHALYGHEGAFKMSDMDAWFTNRVERDAWTVAARLLIPLESITRYGERSRIASVCMVPEWLVELD